MSKKWPRSLKWRMTSALVEHSSRSSPAISKELRNSSVKHLYILFFMVNTFLNFSPLVIVYLILQNAIMLSFTNLVGVNSLSLIAWNLLNCSLVPISIKWNLGSWNSHAPLKFKWSHQRGIDNSWGASLSNQARKTLEENVTGHNAPGEFHDPGFSYIKFGSKEQSDRFLSN